MPEVLVYYDAIQRKRKYWNLLLQQAEVPGTGSEAWTMYENAKV